MHHFGDDVFVFRDAAGAAVKHVSKILLAQTVKRVVYFVFGVGRNGIAIILLIARGDERVQRQGIILRRGDLFLDQRSEHADFNVSQKRHNGSIIRSPHPGAKPSTGWLCSKVDAAWVATDRSAFDTRPSPGRP